MDVELAFMGPDELGAKRRRVNAPKYLSSRDLCGRCCVSVGSSEVFSLYAFLELLGSWIILALSQDWVVCMCV